MKSGEENDVARQLDTRCTFGCDLVGGRTRRGEDRRSAKSEDVDN